eukprot:tig00000405_g501.t1
MSSSTSAGASAANSKVPVTVFTGYLGAGKTTIILNVIKALPQGYKCVWLKNEIGDVAVDSQVAASNSIQSAEMLAGCVCCVLIGQLENALADIITQYAPDRIVLETSGSALPAPIAWAVRRRADIVRLDGIINVVDCVNFQGYKDRSQTAKLQAQYTDVILINKHQLVPETRLDSVLDDVYDLNPDTPKIRVRGKGEVDPAVILGIDTKLFLSEEEGAAAAAGISKRHQAMDVDLIQVIVGEKPAGRACCGDHSHDHGNDHAHAHGDGQACGKDHAHAPGDACGHAHGHHGYEYAGDEATAFLRSLPADAFVRVKGVIRLAPAPASLSHAVGAALDAPAPDPASPAAPPSPGYYVINYVRGRFDLVPTPDYDAASCPLKMVFMGTSDMHAHRARIRDFLRVPDSCLSVHRAD